MKTPRVRNYRLEEILGQRQHLADVLLFDLLGRTAAGAELELLVRLLHTNLPGAPCQERVLLDSVRYLDGQRLTEPLLRDLAYRLSGNLARLRSGTPVPPWTCQHRPEWVPAQIMTARRRRSFKGGQGALFDFRVLAGSACPLLVQSWWSDGRCSFHAKNGFGFDKYIDRKGLRPARYPYRHFRQLVTLRLYLLLDPERSGREPAFVKVDFPTGVRDYNRLQLKRRFRVDPGFTCPRGHPREFPCQLCPAGYLSCPAGTHRHDYGAGACARCKRPDAPFDPELSDKVCVDCYDTYRGGVP